MIYTRSLSDSLRWNGGREKSNPVFVGMKTSWHDNGQRGGCSVDGIPSDVVMFLIAVLHRDWLLLPRVTELPRLHQCVP